MNSESAWIQNLGQALGSQQTEHSAPFLDLKRNAFAKFQEQGFPRFKDEMWKYTNPANFIKNSEPLDVELGSALLDIKDLIAYNISIVDGKLDPNSIAALQSDGLKVGLATGNEPDFSQNFESVIRYGDGFQQLALSAAHEIIKIEVAPNVTLDKPVVLHFVNSGKSKQTGMMAPICFVSLGENSSAQIVEYIYSLGETAAWTQPVTSYRLAPSANLLLLKMISASTQLLSYTHLYQARYSQANVLSIMSGGKVLRNILNVEQDGPGVYCKANGLSLVKSGEHFDVRSRFLHLKPQGTSQQLYKSVVSEKARFVFNGKIYIEKDAQKVDASMLNKNLLLGKLAEADTKPELEVYADDVKAGHGASVGQLDISELFYLMSRGISKRRALELLARAYVDELVLDIPSESLREWINIKLAAQLKTISQQIEASINANEDV